MGKPGSWWWSAARAEIDQRARDARLKLEQVERLLKLPAPPAQSAPTRALDQRVLRFFRGGCVQTGSTRTWPGPRYGRARPIPTDICDAVHRLTAVTGGARPPSPA
jgi:hypothetical protein